MGDFIQQKFFPTLGAGQTVKGEEYKRIIDAIAQAKASGKSERDIDRMNEAASRLYNSMTDEEKASTTLKS